MCRLFFIYLHVLTIKIFVGHLRFHFSGILLRHRVSRNFLLWRICRSTRSCSLWMINFDYFSSRKASYKYKKWLKPAEICDLLKVSILVLCSLMMSYIDTSVIYHLIKSQSVIKLYIFYNMLEVCTTRLLTCWCKWWNHDFSLPSVYRLVTGYSQHLAKISSMLYFGRPLNHVTPELVSLALFCTKFQQLPMSVSFFNYELEVNRWDRSTCKQWPKDFL